MSIENKNQEFKSLKKALGKKANHRDLAETCVCFANAQGGEIVIGIEDKEDAPPPLQIIKQDEVNNLIKSLRSLTDGVGIVHQEILTHQNGGQYFIIQILPSIRTIATTSSGKVLIRISDNCFPVGGDELTRLASEKTDFQWEIIVAQKLELDKANNSKVEKLIAELRNSEKVSEFIKRKSHEEILSFCLPSMCKLPKD